jgi:ankyrin repeat protein
LTYAAENGHIEVCAALLDAGADIVSVALKMNSG